MSMPKSNHYALIMAGGRGTRFWPRSRRNRAKQVLSFDGGRSLIQQTVDRLAPVVAPENIWIVTNDHLRAEIAKQLPEVPKRQIIAEPAARNTAPCIGLTAKILQDLDPDAVLGVFPADHLVSKESRFLRLVRAAYKAAGSGEMVTLGVQPRWPETGYGYVEFPKGVTAGATSTVPVVQFREKPDLATAKKYLKTGRFYWNSGMFFWRADVILDALRHHLPQTHTLLASLPAVSSRTFAAALAEVYPKCENISIDYAVLEKADGVTGIATDDFGWNDLGSWNAVYDLLPKDIQGNVTRGDVLVSQGTGNYVESAGKLVALVGVDHLVVVETADAILVVDRNKAQDVGTLVKLLEQHRREELL